MALSTHEILHRLEQNAPVIRRYGARSLGLFGSGARGTVREDSDLDFVVEFETKSFDTYMDLKAFLERVLGGPCPPGDDPQRSPSCPGTLGSTSKTSWGQSARSSARRILMALLEADLRCLDAHAHLGNLVFDHTAREALRHYEVGVRIGELSLAENFTGVLSWGLVDNRPFLRCMKGYGLCLWRLGRGDEAARVFDRMLWMNPADSQGIRFLLPAVRDGRRWEEPAS